MTYEIFVFDSKNRSVGKCDPEQVLEKKTQKNHHATAYKKGHAEGSRCH